jgi:hypothetical protein
MKSGVSGFTCALKLAWIKACLHHSHVILTLSETQLEIVDCVTSRFFLLQEPVHNVSPLTSITTCGFHTKRSSM